VEPKTKQSRRSFALADDVVKALRKHRKAQVEQRLLAGGEWEEHHLVLPREQADPSMA
jgi:integrase